MRLILANFPILILCTIAGIALGHANIFVFTPPQIILIFFLLALAFLAAFNAPSTSPMANGWRVLLLTLASFFIAYINHQYREQKFFRQQIFFTSYTLDIIGTITNKQDFEHTQQLEIVVTKFRTLLNRTWRSINASIIVHTNRQENFTLGDQIMISNLSCVHPTSEKTWLLQRRGIAAVAFHAQKITLLYHPIWNLKRGIYNFRQQLAYELETKLSPQTYELVTTIFLGAPSQKIRAHSDKILPSTTQEKIITLTKQQNFESFGWWGLNHYLARAGLHVLILLIIFNFCITFVSARFFIKTIISSALFIGYFLISWSNLPFVRAFAALLCANLCHLLRVPINSLQVLNLIIFCFLLLEPIELFCLDFQLTFAITYTLLIISRIRSFCAVA